MIVWSRHHIRIQRGDLEIGGHDWGFIYVIMFRVMYDVCSRQRIDGCVI